MYLPDLCTLVDLFVGEKSQMDSGGLRTLSASSSSSGSSSSDTSSSDSSDTSDSESG